MLNCNHIQSVEMLMKHLWSWKLLCVEECMAYVHFVFVFVGVWPHLPIVHLSMPLIYLFSVNNLFGVCSCVCGFFSLDRHSLLTFASTFGNHHSCSFALSSWLNLSLFNFHTVSNRISWLFVVRIPRHSHQREIEASKSFGLPSDFPKQWMLSLSAYYYPNLLSDQ